MYCTLISFANNFLISSPFGQITHLLTFFLFFTSSFSSDLFCTYSSTFCFKSLGIVFIVDLFWIHGKVKDRAMWRRKHLRNLECGVVPLSITIASMPAVISKWKNMVMGHLLVFLLWLSADYFVYCVYISFGEVIKGNNIRFSSSYCGFFDRNCFLRCWQKNYILLLFWDAGNQDCILPKVETSAIFFSPSHTFTIYGDNSFYFCALLPQASNYC